MSATNRVVYISTLDGLYRARPDGTSYTVDCIGFKGKGPFRAPVLVDCDDSRVLYAGTTKSGMHRSRDGGNTWQEIDEGIVYKEIWAIAQHPKTGTLYAGTGPADVFMSADRGDTWSECETFGRLPTTKGWHGPQPPHVSRLRCVGLYRDDPQRIYGTIEEGWAVRSFDGGKTWEQLDDGIGHDGHHIALMPDNPRVLVAGCGEGVFRSEDGGSHWTETREGMGERRRYAPAPLVQHPARPNVIVTALSAGPFPRAEGGQAAFIRSQDQGRTWELSRQGLPEEPYAAVPRGLAGDPQDPNTYLCGMTDGTLWESTDGGESFRRILGDLPSIMSISVSRN